MTSVSPRTAGEPSAVLDVERAEPGDEGVRGGGVAERPGDRARDLGVADRVEPDVRVEPAADTQRARVVEDVEGRPAPPVDRSLDRGLEPVADVHDERRLLDAPDVPRRQLEVVRLGAGRRQVGDTDVLPSDLLGRVRQGIEGRDHRVSGGIAAAPTRCDNRRQADAQENDSRKHAGRA